VAVNLVVEDLLLLINPSVLRLTHSFIHGYQSTAQRLSLRGLVIVRLNQEDQALNVLLVFISQINHIVVQRVGLGGAHPHGAMGAAVPRSSIGPVFHASVDRIDGRAHVTGFVCPGVKRRPGEGDLSCLLSEDLAREIEAVLVRSHVALIAASLVLFTPVVRAPRVADHVVASMES